MSKIIYTITDEAPALATYSLLPIIKAFTSTANISVETKDISLSGRIIANFTQYLSPDKRINDDLNELSEIMKSPDANIIKLPNISASIPQLQDAIKELQSKGYNIPNYPEAPSTQEEINIKSTFDKILGSAVNPVIRQGNSDRRAPKAVKAYVKEHPHKLGQWSEDSTSHVSDMSSGDFYESEKSTTLDKDTVAQIVFEDNSAVRKILKEGIKLIKGEIIDTSVMNYKALAEFLEKEINDAYEKNILFSIHLKATMMKISDPIIFGVAIKVFFKDVFDKYSDVFDKLNINANNGLVDIYNKIESLPEDKQNEIKKAIDDVYKVRPSVAMVDSDKGITNLHAPNNIIIDASMPAAIRSSGKMWNAEGELENTKAVIPDRCYSGVYRAVIDFCKKHGAFDPTTMGSVPNVGLMSQKAEEYGSHNTTFQPTDDGKILVLDADGNTLLEQPVYKKDIFRMSQTKDIPVKEWVALAIERAKISRTPAIFWLDENRSHDREIIKKMNTYLKDYDTSGLEISISKPINAAQKSLVRMKQGQNTISVTGNVLRDYLTDLFPILELGTSSKMLSIIPLTYGGKLFETGAGGSAPKLIEQLIEENHLRWDSMGEFLAICESIEHLARTYNNDNAKELAKCLDMAIKKFLDENKSPSRKVKEIDNRGSHFYLAKYWAEAITSEHPNQEVKNIFANVSKALNDNESAILEELISVQGPKVDIGGYYKPDDALASAVMRPSKKFNYIIDNIK